MDQSRALCKGYALTHMLDAPWQRNPAATATATATAADVARTGTVGEHQEQQAAGGCVYATLLREPVARLVSALFYCREMSASSFAETTALS